MPDPRAVTWWKVMLFFAGAVFLGLGVALGIQALILAAIVTLAAAVVLRFVGRPPRKEIDPSWYEDEHGGDGRR
jgi:membrane protein implicated in regulation of membrane protease activity